MKQFQGRVVVPGTCSAEALVSHKGFNTLASYRTASREAGVPCNDQSNPEIYQKDMLGKALCIPLTIGSSTAGMILYNALSTGRGPACMCFSESIDPLAASGAVLGAVWTDANMPVIDRLGAEFLDTVKTGSTVTIKEGGIVEVD